MKNKLREILRILFALLFVTTAIGKLLDIPGFAAVLGTYELFPSRLLFVFALLISLSELFLGVLLFARRKLFLVAQATLWVNLGYLLLALITLARGLNIPNCGCFGVFLARPLTSATVGEDALIVILSYLFL